jgi:hypothetical protein
LLRAQELPLLPGSGFAAAASAFGARARRLAGQVQGLLEAPLVVFDARDALGFRIEQINEVMEAQLANPDFKLLCLQPVAWLVHDHAGVAKFGARFGST